MPAITNLKGLQRAMQAKSKLDRGKEGRERGRVVQWEAWQGMLELN